MTDRQAAEAPEMYRSLDALRLELPEAVWLDVKAKVDALSVRLAQFEALADSLEAVLFGDNQSRDRDELEARAAELVAADVRLAQAEQNSIDLRAVWKATERELAEERARLREVEQERDEAVRLNEYEVLLRERDEAINDALNAEVRLREYEEALTRLFRGDFGFVGHVNACGVQLGEECTCGFSGVAASGGS